MYYMFMFVYIYRGQVLGLPLGHWWISNNREGTSLVNKYMYILIYICTYMDM